MSVYKLNSILLFSIFVLGLMASSSHVHAATAAEGNTGSALKQERKLEKTEARPRNTISLNYVSWLEQLELEQGLAKANGFAQFYGNSLSYEREGSGKNWVSSYQATLMLGQANGGESGLPLTYQTANLKWNGLSASAKFGYRPSESTLISLGPILLQRSINWPDQTGVSAKSGSVVNYGMILSMKLRPSPSWEISQDLGTLLAKSSTYWSAGLGYRF